jgi:uncharacterized protein (DUF2235 family)
MPKRLALFFDGTWNTPESGTNVWTLHGQVAARGADGKEQRRYYHTGVGTSWHGRILGGAFGYGLSENICAGYTWLAQNFVPGDEIFVFGFSRGAYTARSLVGLVRKCGVLDSPTDALVRAAYELYRERRDTVDGPDATAFRAANSHETRVRFVGVWDTVGSLGIPVTGLKLAPFRSYYRFHDTSLSKIVDYAYHALAIDEYREDYAPTLWTETKPENVAVEQRWFIGAHCNVGGGYQDDTLCRIPARWLQDRAVAAGLAMDALVPLTGTEWRTEPRNSFKEFMWGLYAAVKGKPYLRHVAGTVAGWIDETVWRRRRAPGLPDYAPAPLAAIPEGTGSLVTADAPARERMPA